MLVCDFQKFFQNVYYFFKIFWLVKFDEANFGGVVVTKSRNINIKWNDEILRQKIEEASPGRWDLSKTHFIKVAEKVVVICPEHGEVLGNIQSLVKGMNCCTECNGQKPVTKSEFIEKTKEIFGEDYFDYSHMDDNFKGLNNRVVLTCKKHNENFNQIARSALSGKIACFYCKPAGKRQPVDLLVARCREVWLDKNYDYSLLTSELGMTKEQQIGCPVEGHGFFMQKLDNHLNGKEGCVKCHQNNVRMDVPEFIRRSKEIYGEDKYDYSNVILEKYGIGKVWLDCPKHGRFSYSVFSHLHELEGCKECRKIFGPSVAEKHFADFVESLGHDVIRSDRQTLDGKEIDVFVPSLNIGFEFNGTYFHSNKFIKDSAKHKEKYELAKNKNIKLIQIWDVDWLKNKNNIKKYVKQVLYKATIKNVVADVLTAKSLVMESIDKNVFKNLLSENSPLCFVESDVYLALKNADEKIVSIASFVKYNNDYYVSRFVNVEECMEDAKNVNDKLTENTIETNGYFDLLIECFESSYEYNNLYFVDDNMLPMLDLFTLRICQNNNDEEKSPNWVECYEIEPDYQLVKGTGKYVKYLNEKGVKMTGDSTFMFNRELNDKEIALSNDMLKIYDAGKTVYRKTRSVV